MEVVSPSQDEAETMLAQIKGIKIAYPSNAADFKGCLKLFYDPNPVIFLRTQRSLLE